MNDTSAVTKLGANGRRSAASVRGVGAFEHGDARVDAQPVVEQAVADVDGDHAAGAVLQQAVDEAAGRAAEVADLFATRRRRRARAARD